MLLRGRQAGTVVEGKDGRLTLTYHEDWRTDPDAVPLSLSMPLAERQHGDRVVRATMWGLLPDNEQVLERWARRYQVSAGNPLALLRHVGEDCAGAAQFVPPDRVPLLLMRGGGVEWIDQAAIAQRLRTLRRDPTAWHTASTGQFSLAGAQAKTALHLDSGTGEWGDPWGSVPTTHILKPAVVGFDEHDLNEHLCLETARRLGIVAASSRVTAFEDERAIVVDRYDRAWTGDGSVRRVHQEDMCQALGLAPTTKYQNEGGPTPEQIIALLRREIRPAGAADGEVERFVDALAFNWIIGGTDGHAKNYSVLLAEGQVRLAPLYDVASALPYDDMYLPKLRMAMRIGGEYRLTALSGRHWRGFATANWLDPDALIARVDDLARRAPAALATATAAAPVRALGSDLPHRLLDQVGAHAARCRSALKQ